LVKKPNKTRAASRSTEPDAGESRGAVALTVAWMLTAMSTAAAMLVVAAVQAIMAANPAVPGRPHPMLPLSSVMLFVALATGIVCLVFTPLAYRVRRSRPPTAITIAAILIGLSPLVTIVGLAIWR
jgi:hypothetical protein